MQRKKLTLIILSCLAHGCAFSNEPDPAADGNGGHALHETNRAKSPEAMSGSSPNEPSVREPHLVGGTPGQLAGHDNSTDSGCVDPDCESEPNAAAQSGGESCLSHSCGAQEAVPPGAGRPHTPCAGHAAPMGGVPMGGSPFQGGADTGGAGLSGGAESQDEAGQGGSIAGSPAPVRCGGATSPLHND